MKRLVITASLIVLMLCVNAIAQTSAKPVEITGFRDGMSAVENDQQAQIALNVATPIKAILAREPNDRITIIITGCAAQTGADGTNEKVTWHRAESVEAEILKQLPPGRFPTVTIKTGSNGYKTGTRIALVSWDIARLRLSSPPLFPNERQTHQLIALGILAIAGFTFIVIKLSNRPINVMAPPAPQTTSKEDLRIITEQDEYVVTTLLRKGEQGYGFYLPFLPPNNFREKRGAAKNAAANALKRLTQQEISALVAKGYLRVKTEMKGVAS